MLLQSLTILKLDLYFQVLSEQVHHHRLHVTSDATAIPVGDKHSLASRKEKCSIVLTVHRRSSNKENNQYRSNQFQCYKKSSWHAANYGVSLLDFGKVVPDLMCSRSWSVQSVTLGHRL